MVSEMSGQLQGKRKRLVRGMSSLNGIDFLEVSLDQKSILLHFIHDLPGQPGGLPAAVPPLTEKNVLFTGGERIWDVRAVSVHPDRDVLTIDVNKPGDFSNYRLCLVKSPQDLTSPEGFDPQLSHIEFSFKRSCPSDLASILDTEHASELQAEPQIDYQAKDYASFMRLMLDRLSTVMPQWKERHPSDMMMAVLELLAYAGDHLSYFQDAVASEAYLETARKRYSVRRHARLLDYRVDEGCNSRVWVCFEAEGGGIVSGEDGKGRKAAKAASDGANAIQLAAGDRLLTRCDTSETVIPADDPEYWKKLAFASGAVVFELMHNLAVFPAHSRILFYDWHEGEYTLPKGATSATLQDSTEREKMLHLEAGDVLIFEEVASLTPGGSPNPSHRHAVRLTSVQNDIDPLDNQSVVNIHWHIDDALPWDLPVHARINGIIRQNIFCVRGNVALADQGRTVYNREILAQESQNGLFRQKLSHKNITFCTYYEHELSKKQPASSCLLQNSFEARPAVKLHEDGLEWTARPDLLSSGRSSPHFVVETEEDGSAILRFGDDIFGRKPSPGSELLATYRVGNASSGNVGSDSIAHLVPQISMNMPQTKGMAITGVRNPMPAQGGIDGEPTEQVRLYAPHIFKRNERGVTEEDYARAALLYPDVNGAVATLRWTGSWHTMFVTVDRRDGLELDTEFRTGFRKHLERYRLAGHDIEIKGPTFVPLHIAFTVHVRSNYLKEDVRIGLLKTFSRGILANRMRGFFHPDNFSFGQPVFLSQIVDLAMEVIGVSWIDVSNIEKHHFHRWGKPAQDEIVNGVIFIDRLEIARLDNDPNVPENGKIEFFMEGGL